MRRAAPYFLGLVLSSGCDRSAAEHVTSAASLDASPASSSVEAAAPSTPPAVEASAPVALPAPSVPAAAVTVENIGMHIGGGPNDAVSKAPIGGSVTPHFGELGACWAQVGDPARGGDFGVDLLIPAEGGRATVSHPRTTLGPEGFRDCVVAVFTAIDFARPRTGRTTVSYSLRFTPASTP
jgi:hypothetical protein